MRLLFDTNVVLDVLCNRRPFAGDAAELFAWTEKGRIAGFLCATTITTVHYLAAKSIGKDRAETQIGRLLTLFDVAPVNRAVLAAALAAGFPDFEDAVLNEAAASVDAGIVTRNHSDFRLSKLVVYAPDELVKVLRAVT